MCKGYIYCCLLLVCRYWWFCNWLGCLICWSFDDVLDYLVLLLWLCSYFRLKWWCWKFDCRMSLYCSGLGVFCYLMINVYWIWLYWIYIWILYWFCWRNLVCCLLYVFKFLNLYLDLGCIGLLWVDFCWCWSYCCFVFFVLIWCCLLRYVWYCWIVSLLLYKFGW